MTDQPEVPTDKGSTKDPKEPRHMLGGFANKLTPPNRRAKDDQEAEGEKSRILAEATQEANLTIDRAKQEAEAEHARILADLSTPSQHMDHEKAG